MIKILLSIALVALAAFGYLYVTSPIAPVAWTPAPNPGLAGEFAPNAHLAQARRLLEGQGVGPEAVACGADGRRYTGWVDGRILAFDARGDFSELADTGGRPLGMKMAGDGRLIVADPIRGLLAVSAEGEIELLADSVDGERMRIVNDLDIAADGTIWFSDASRRHGLEHGILDFFEAVPSGRLLSYSPATGEVQAHLDGLFFANGVALGPGDDFVLVSETGSGQIHRLWLKGERAGQRDLFHSGLPGLPDNITFNGRDTFWVAMPALRSEIDWLANKPLLRRLMAGLPHQQLEAGTRRYGFVLGLNLEGKVVHNLQDASLGYTDTTSAIECDGALYLGSLSMPAVARYPL